jgi:hypothetical protein
VQARLIVRLAGIGAALSLLGAGTTLARSGEVTHAIADQKFCAGAIAHDYTRPFSRMPPARPLPHSGKLPFLPGNVRLFKPGQATLVLGGFRDLSYYLSIASGELLSREVDLQVKARLNEVSARGRPLQVIRTAGFRIKTRNPATVDRQQVSFELPARAGFFRVDADFARTDGSPLAQYHEYFRSVRPTFRTRLEVARDAVKAGDRLFFRVANIGTQPIAFGEEFRVEARDGGRWSRVDLALGPWHRLRLGLGPGEAGKCQSFVIPDVLDPNGSYRFVKDLLRPSMAISSDKFTVVP